MADMTDQLLGRVANQARDYGELALTPGEFEQLAEFVNHAPNASVIVGSGRSKKVRPIRSLVVKVLPDLDFDR